MPSEWERGFADGFRAGQETGTRGELVTQGEVITKAKRARKVRKVSAYHRRLGRILKRLKKKHTLKNGNLRKGWTNARLMKTAHKEAKKK